MDVNALLVFISKVVKAALDVGFPLILEIVSWSGGFLN